VRAACPPYQPLSQHAPSVPARRRLWTAVSHHSSRGARSARGLPSVPAPRPTSPLRISSRRLWTAVSHHSSRGARSARGQPSDQARDREAPYSRPPTRPRPLRPSPSQISNLKFQIPSPPQALDCWENRSSLCARSAPARPTEAARPKALGLRKPAAAFPEPARWPGTNQATPPFTPLQTSPSPLCASPPSQHASLPTKQSHFKLLTSPNPTAPLHRVSQRDTVYQPGASLRVPTPTNPAFCRNAPYLHPAGSSRPCKSWRCSRRCGPAQNATTPGSPANEASNRILVDLPSDQVPRKIPTLRRTASLSSATAPRASILANTSSRDRAGPSP
jgi:hypothetical protein